MKEKDTTYLNCVHCGKCLPVCPSYNTGLNEFFSPRGRVRLVLTDNADKLPLRASKVAESMSACLLCGRCVKICPNDVKIDELVIDEKIKLNESAGRAFSIDKFALKALKSKRKVLLKSALKIANIPIIEKLAGRYAPQPEGKSFIADRDLIFNADAAVMQSPSGNRPALRAPLLERRGVIGESIYTSLENPQSPRLKKRGVIGESIYTSLENPQSLRLKKRGVIGESIYTSLENPQSLRLKKRGVIGESIYTSLENPQSLRLKKRGVIRQSADEDGKNIFKVGYFSGCVFNNIYPQISADTVTSLTKNGIEVFVPKSQGCCGLPFISSGDVKSFKELALNNAAAFRGKDLEYIITSCASCSYSINKLYPLYFCENDEDRADILNFSNKLLNIWSFFKELEKNGVNVKAGKLKQETSAVFHIPCHLSNSSEFKSSSENERLIGEAGLIIDKIDGLKLKPLKHNYCCGNGGMFNIRHYDLSKKITKRKFKEIREASPEEILTSCSGCMFSLKDQTGTLKENERLPVSHLVSVYAQSLKELKE